MSHGVLHKHPFQYVISTAQDGAAKHFNVEPYSEMELDMLVHGSKTDEL